MHSLKNNSRNTSVTNDAYESDVDKIDHKNKIPAEIERKPGHISNRNEKDFIGEFDVDPDQRRPSLPLSQPTRNDFSIENLTKSHLSGIPEERKRKDANESNMLTSQDNEVDVKDNAYTNMGFKNMSLSNFKMLHGYELEHPNSDVEGLKRDASHASIIHMKQIQNDAPIQTGRNFRKIATFVITPKENQLNLDGEDRLNVKMVDRQNTPELFIQLDSLYLNQASNNYYWIEKYRWIKFEEDYNYETQHFNSPHMSPLTIKSITQFRKTFSKGEMILDCNHEMFTNLLSDIADSITKCGTFTEIEMFDIRNALGYKRNHAGEHLNTSGSEISMYRYDAENQRYQHNEMFQKRSVASFSKLEAVQRKFSYMKLEEKLDPNTEAMSVQVGALESLSRTLSVFVRLNTLIKAEKIIEIDCPLRFIFLVFGPKSKEEDLIEIGRAFSVMMSNIEFREIGYSANTKEEILEATKTFVNHSALIPLNRQVNYDTLAAMLPHMKHYFNCFLSEQNQKIFNEMKNELTFKNQGLIISKIEGGNKKKISVSTLALNPSQLSEFEDNNKKENESITTNVKNPNKARQVILQFCPPFRYFITDIKGLKSRFVSDFTDAFKNGNAPIVFIGILFIYFVVMAPAITFGALLNAVNPKMTVSMMLLASGFYQFFPAFFGGQPFEILGITGPVFAVEKILGSLSISIGIPLEAMRFWIGIYVTILGIVTVAFNGIIILKHVRRSVEEIYNFLVSAIYILSALFSMFKALPYIITPLEPNNTNANIIVVERLKFGIAGSNLFLAFFMANFCLILIRIKKGTFYRRETRKLLGALNVPLGIILVIAMNQIFFRSCSLPTLNVPPSNAVNFSLWFNIPTASSIMSLSSKAHGFCFLIGLSLFAIIICEISCNTILVIRGERKLLKPSLFSLNFFYVLIIFPIISGTLGWPFISGGTVRSHVHCMAMTIWSLRLPGEPPKVTGAVEQRVSGSVVGVLVLLSVFLGSALQYIPMASMYGMFLFMGIIGLVDLVFIRRIMNLLRRRKYWKNHNFLKDFPTWNIMIFVLIQIFFVAILILLYCISEFTTTAWTPLLFPWTIILFALVRGYILPLWPRLNIHLSKMDKKHPVKLYSELKTMENVILTVDQNGVDIKVVETVGDSQAYENSEYESDSGEDKIKNMEIC